MFQIKEGGLSKKRQGLCIPMQERRHIARRTPVIHRCVRSLRRPQASFQQTSSEEGETRDPSPDLEARQDAWSIVGNYICRNRVAPRTKLDVPKDDFPTLQYYIDVQRQSKTSIVVLHEATIDDFWNVDGYNSLSEPPEGLMWVQDRLTRKQFITRLGNIWPEERSSSQKRFAPSLVVRHSTHSLFVLCILLPARTESVLVTFSLLGCSNSPCTRTIHSSCLPKKSPQSLSAKIEANLVLKAKVLQNTSRRFDVSSLHMFPDNQAVWGAFMNSCMWAAVYLSKDDEDINCIVQKFGSAKDPHSLGNGASAVDLDKWSLEKLLIQCWIKSLLRNSHQKCMCSAVRAREQHGIHFILDDELDFREIMNNVR